MDSISSAPSERLENTKQAQHHNRSNFGRRLTHPGHFQAILFYSPELAHESTTKPRLESQSFSPPEGTMRLGRDNEGAHELGRRDLGNSVVLGQSA